MKRHNRIVKLKDSKPKLVLKYAMTCVCGHIVTSERMGREPAMRDVEYLMSRHTKGCETYKFLMHPAIACTTLDELEKHLSG